MKYYETEEVRDSQKRIIVPAGLEVPSDYSVTYYDSGLKRSVTSSKVKEVTNYEYEIKLDNDKRNIYLLKAEYISIITNDIEGELLYERGSSQYISPTLVRGDNIRRFS